MMLGTRVFGGVGAFAALILCVTSVKAQEGPAACVTPLNAEPVQSAFRRTCDGRARSPKIRAPRCGKLLDISPSIQPNYSFPTLAGTVAAVSINRLKDLRSRDPGQSSRGVYWTSAAGTPTIPSPLGHANLGNPTVYARSAVPEDNPDVSALDTTQRYRITLFDAGSKALCTEKFKPDGSVLTDDQLAVEFVRRANAEISSVSLTLVKSATLQYDYFVAYDSMADAYNAYYIGAFEAKERMDSYFADYGDYFYYALIPESGNFYYDPYTGTRF